MLFAHSGAHPPPSSPESPTRKGPYLATVLAIVGLVVALATTAVWLEKQRYRERAEAATHNIAYLLDTHLSEVFSNIDNDLDEITYYFQHALLPKGGRLEQLHDYVQQIENQNGYFDNFRLLDKNGLMHRDRGTPLAQPLDLSDRDYFVQARDQTSKQTVVVGPIQSRITGRWVMVLAKRLETPDGQFEGVICATIGNDQLGKIFSRMDLGPYGAATLRTADLALVYRFPDSKGAIGSREVSKQLRDAIAARPVSGQYLAATALDGIERSNAYRKLEHYPFYVIVGLSTEDYMRGWWLNSVVLLVLAGLTVVAVVVAGLRSYRTQKLTATRLQREEIWSAAIVESSQDAIIAQSPEGLITTWNQGAERIFGYSAQEMIGQPASVLTPHGWGPSESKGPPESLFEETENLQESTIQRKDGRVLHIASTLSTLQNERGEHFGQAIIARDITHLKEDENKIKLAASVFTHAHEGIVITDAQVRIVDVNREYERITGFDRTELIGNNPRVTNAGREQKDLYAHMWQSLRAHGHWQGEIWNRRKSGELYAAKLTISTVEDASGAVKNYVGILSDITALKSREEALEHAAFHDQLTGLPNRILLEDRFKQAVAQSARTGRSLAVMVLDLDGFKQVNDTLGHEAGDLLLTTMARRMKDVLREGDTLARLGGDEFVALLVDLEHRDQCAQVLERLLHQVAEPVYLGDHKVAVSASIGATLYPDDQSDETQLIRQADQAMYRAKQRGKNQIAWSDEPTSREQCGAWPPRTPPDAAERNPAA